MTVRPYRDIGFQAAPPGWRMIFLARNGHGVWTYPIPGWLVQERTDDQYEPLISTPSHDRERRVVPAFWSQAFGVELQPADIDDDDPVWVLGPGQPDPTEDEIVEAHREAATVAANLAARNLARRFFDAVIVPQLRGEGKSEQDVVSSRRRFVRDNVTNQEALDRFRAHFSVSDQQTP